MKRCLTIFAAFILLVFVAPPAYALEAIVATIAQGEVQVVGGGVSATGVDGDLQKGVALPNPRFTDNGDGTITDNVTELIWLKNANCPNTGRDWPTALADVASLNSTGYMNGNDCGDTSNAGNHQTDWRLPKIRELLSLLNFAFNSPAISNAAGTGKGSGSDPFANFPAASLSPYWSSTAKADDSGTVWGVGFSDGDVLDFRASNDFFVTAVRGGP
jgi:Protein of unknown function (DUF1566)